MNNKKIATNAESVSATTDVPDILVRKYNYYSEQYSSEVR